MSWISFQQAREDCGGLDWWNEADFPIEARHPHAPRDCPIFVSSRKDSLNAEDDDGSVSSSASSASSSSCSSSYNACYYYYGDWCQTQDGKYECHGHGVFFLPREGQCYAGPVHRNVCHGGRGTLRYLHRAQVEDNEQENEQEEGAASLFDGSPFDYRGKFVQGVKHDVWATVTFSNDTIWQGAFRDDEPVLEEDEDEPPLLCACQTTHDNDTTTTTGPYWLTCHEAQPVSHGQAAWWKLLDWKIPGDLEESSDKEESYSEQILQKHGPHPIWYNPNSDWMYCGGLVVQQHEDSQQEQEHLFHGKGVLYFPNGRLLLAHFHFGHLVGEVLWMWLPNALAWRRNVHQQSPLQGHPYIYQGFMHDNVRSDPHALVVLKDGTTRWGPWFEDEPVGNWWTEHSSCRPKHCKKQPINVQELLAVFEDDTPTSTETKHSSVPSDQQDTLEVTVPTNINMSNDDDDDDDDEWISMDEARKRSYGQVDWWKCPGPNGKILQPRQYRTDAPQDRPVYCPSDAGWMYWGHWKTTSSNEPELHGFGVFYFPNGRVFVGMVHNGECHGPARLLWVPAAPFWEQNQQQLSVLKTTSNNTDGQEQPIGLPYLYLGNYKNGEKDDTAATILLKDGSTRRGAFAHDKPVGNWQEWPSADNKDGETSLLQDLLSFGGTADDTLPDTGVRSLVLAVKQQQRQQQSHDELALDTTDQDWLTFDQARQLSHGKVAWWEIPGIDGKRVPKVQQHVFGPPDKPVWSNTSQGWMYLGGWDNASNQFHGYGVFLLPTGRVYVGQFSQGQWSGLGKLVWLPNAPDWERNEQTLSAIQQHGVGVPYLYFGVFENGERCDPEATVVLKDGTSRVGPFQDSLPIGDWWQHKVLESRIGEVEALSMLDQSKLHKKVCAGDEDETSATNSITSFSSEAEDRLAPLPSAGLFCGADVDQDADLAEGERWISLQEAKERAYGQVEWWKLLGPHGKAIPERQHRLDGPSDRPVWLDLNGSMYLGGWKDNEYHGSCAMCFSDGRVFLGCIDQNKCSGPGKILWLPEAPAWLKNEDPKSLIFTEEGSDKSTGLPYTYIGLFQNSAKNDSRARVTLRDGTARIGPFENDRPVGNWWDHELCNTDTDCVSNFSLFGRESSLDESSRVESVGKEYSPIIESLSECSKSTGSGNDHADIATEGESEKRVTLTDIPLCSDVDRTGMVVDERPEETSHPEIGIDKNPESDSRSVIETTPCGTPLGGHLPGTSDDELTPTLFFEAESGKSMKDTDIILHTSPHSATLKSTSDVESTQNESGSEINTPRTSSANGLDVRMVHESAEHLVKAIGFDAACPQESIVGDCDLNAAKATDGVEAEIGTSTGPLEIANLAAGDERPPEEIIDVNRSKLKEIAAVNSNDPEVSKESKEEGSTKATFPPRFVQGRVDANAKMSVERSLGVLIALSSENDASVDTVEPANSTSVTDEKSVAMATCYEIVLDEQVAMPMGRDEILIERVTLLQTWLTREPNDNMDTWWGYHGSVSSGIAGNGDNPQQKSPTFTSGGQSDSLSHKEFEDDDIMDEDPQSGPSSKESLSSNVAALTQFNEATATEFPDRTESAQKRDSMPDLAGMSKRTGNQDTVARPQDENYQIKSEAKGVQALLRMWKAREPASSADECATPKLDLLPRRKDSLDAGLSRPEPEQEEISPLSSLRVTAPVQSEKEPHDDRGSSKDIESRAKPVEKKEIEQRGGMTSNFIQDLESAPKRKESLSKTGSPGLAQVPFVRESCNVTVSFENDKETAWLPGNPETRYLGRETKESESCLRISDKTSLPEQRDSSAGGGGKGVQALLQMWKAREQQVVLTPPRGMHQKVSILGPSKSESGSPATLQNKESGPIENEGKAEARDGPLTAENVGVVCAPARTLFQNLAKSQLKEPNFGASNDADSKETTEIEESRSAEHTVGEYEHESSRNVSDVNTDEDVEAVHTPVTTVRREVPLKSGWIKDELGECTGLYLGETGGDEESKPRDNSIEEDYSSRSNVEFGTLEDVEVPLVPVGSDQEKRRKDKILSLQNWLTEEVIGYDALQDDIEKYAQHLLDSGLHSGRMIQDVCTPDDAEEFLWMKKFHRRCFVSYLRKQQD